MAIPQVRITRRSILKGFVVVPVLQFALGMVTAFVLIAFSGTLAFWFGDIIPQLNKTSASPVVDQEKVVAGVIVAVDVLMLYIIISTMKLSIWCIKGVFADNYKRNVSFLVLFLLTSLPFVNWKEPYKNLNAVSVLTGTLLLLSYRIWQKVSFRVGRRSGNR